VNTNPGALNGPPIMTEDGIVLGGNSRTMSIQKAYADHPQRANAYRDHLKENAGTFGFTAEDVEGMANPILVREAIMEDKSPEAYKGLVRTLNEGLTQQMDPRTYQLSLSRKLKPEHLEPLTGSMRDGEDLRSFLDTSRAQPFVEALSRAGIIDSRNESAYISGGRLNREGRHLVQGVLLGQVLPDSDLANRLEVSNIDAMSRAAPYLIQAKQHGEGYDLTQSLQHAWDAYAELRYRADGQGIAAFNNKLPQEEVNRRIDGLKSAQLDAFAEEGGAQPHPIFEDGKARRLLDVLVQHGMSQHKFSRVFKDLASEASRHSQVQATIGADDPATVFERVMSKHVPIEPKATPDLTANQRGFGDGDSEEGFDERKDTKRPEQDKAAVDAAMVSLF